jgi:AraC-like DNA-binding protein
MSESCFQARFKKETGLSLINYAPRRKMDVAKARLTASDDPITRIALDLGFSSSQNFATTFKRIAGRPPTKYRLDTKEAGEPPHPAT